MAVKLEEVVFEFVFYTYIFLHAIRFVVLTACDTYREMKRRISKSR
ncbi:MAG: hypothetical protein ABSF46_16300 [Terriglobia bacterium]